MNVTRVLLAVAGLSIAASVCAQTFPVRPIRMLTGFPPASAADIVARMISPRMSESLGQTIIVDNRPGGGSSIAAEVVARAAPDGYTLLLGSSPNVINTSLVKGLSFDFLRDFVAIGSVAALPNILVVHPSLKARTVQELIAEAKAKPGMLYGSSGSGATGHLAAEVFNLEFGTRFTHVPYKGSPPAVADLLAGRVVLSFSPVSTVMPHVKAGTLRALATTGTRRSVVAPDLPTVAEAVLPGFEAVIWFGLLAPAGTAVEILERLNRETNRVLADADIKAQLAKHGIETMGGTRAEFAAYLKEETEKWAKVVEKSGAKPD